MKMILNDTILLHQYSDHDVEFKYIQDIDSMYDNNKFTMDYIIEHFTSQIPSASYYDSLKPFWIWR